jgi:hypothetical protein
MQKNYIQIECDIIEWHLQNDAKKMQTNAMWLHLVWFVKTCHATRSQQNGCDFLMGFWKLIMKQKNLNKMHDVVFLNNILVDFICLFSEHHLSHLCLNWFFLWEAIFTYWRTKKSGKKYFVIISLFRSKRKFRKKI